LIAASQPGEKEDELCVGHQARLPVEQAVLSLKRAAWSFRVLPNVVGTFKSTPDDQYPEPPARRIGTAAVISAKTVSEPVCPKSSKLT